MKKIILFTAILISAMAAEAQGKNDRMNFHCTEIVEDGQKYLTVDLYDENGGGPQEGERVKYSVEVLENDGISDGSVVYSGRVIATAEDVQVWFKDVKKKISIGLYMDSEDDHWIKIGRKTHNLRCDLEVEELP